MLGRVPGDWQSALRFIAYQRDPRRLGWLLVLLLRDARRAMVRASAEGGNETSLAQANTLRFLAPVLLELGWRAAPLAEAPLRAPLLRAWSTHAYNQVREEAGNTLAYILHAFTPPPPRHAAVGAAMTAAIDGFLDHLVAAADADADASAAAAPPPPTAPRRDAARAARGAGARSRAARECILRVVHRLTQGRPRACAPRLPKLLAAVAFTAANVAKPTPERRAAARAHRAGARRRRAAAALLGPLDVLGVVAPPRRFAAAARPPLYRTQFLGGGGGGRRGRCSSGSRRRPAGGARGGGGGVRRHRAAARPAGARARRVGGGRTRPKAALPERHGGVLALAALLRLAPYDIPPWLPPVIEKLAPFVAAPQPIKGTVTKAFADFKRTHQDDWAAQREKLTPEQQELISDTLISPSFYA